MGIRSWRANVFDRVDAMEGRAKEREAAAVAKRDAVKAGVDAARAERVAESTSLWGESRARALGEDHNDLLARAAALGVPAPVPDRQMRGRVFGALGELVMMDGAGTEGGTVDSYEAWRDRIVVEESMAAKEARGESLSWGDRLALKVARSGSK